jgi:hypothetical protein
MEWYEAEVRELEKNRLRNLYPQCPAVFYGSSSIRLWSSLAADLQSPRVVNLGFGGSTLAACVHFFERLVRPAAPSSLIVYAGDNDLGDGRSADDVIASFRALSTRVRAHCDGIPFGFISIKLSPARFHLRAAIDTVNEAVRTQMEALHCSCFASIASIRRVCTVRGARHGRASHAINNTNAIFWKKSFLSPSAIRTCTFIHPRISSPTSTKNACWLTCDGCRLFSPWAMRTPSTRAPSR